jgi:ATP-dependent protease ClpP protease subunit
MCGFLLTAGGSPYAVIAILDTLKTIKPDVSTIAFGQSLSTATLLLVRLGSNRLLTTTASL